MINIRAVLPEEAETISLLAIRSKAYWGYSDEFMRACADELSSTAEDLRAAKSIYYAADLSGELAGFYQLEIVAADTVMLEALFVDPGKIGRGIGKALFRHAVTKATELDGKYLEVQSDPYAEPFYTAVGMHKIGEMESGSIVGRFLPILKLDLTK